MEFKTTEDIENYFKVLEDNDLSIPGVYDPAQKVIEQKMINLVLAGNKNELDISVMDVIKTIQLKKMTSFKEMGHAVEEYFSQFSTKDKLIECYKTISLAGTQIDGERLVEAKKEFGQSTTFVWGLLVDMRKSLKFNLGRFDVYNDHYSITGNYKTEAAIKCILKHFFDVEIDVLCSWSEADLGKWISYGNGLQGKMYKSGVFEIKHEHLDVLTREIKHYYNSNLTHYFIQA